ncbi:C2 domain-containing protein, partial [Haematococcus lacustris]
MEALGAGLPQYLSGLAGKAFDLQSVLDAEPGICMTERMAVLRCSLHKLRSCLITLLTNAVGQKPEEGTNVKEADVLRQFLVSLQAMFEDEHSGSPASRTLAASSVGADAAAVRTASTSYASALLQAAMADSADLQDFYSVQLSCLQHARLTPRDAGNVFVELGPQQLPLVDLLRILRQRRKAEASTQAFVTDKLREASAIITQVVFGLVSSERVVSEVRCSLPGPGAVRAGGRLVITQEADVLRQFLVSLQAMFEDEHSGSPASRTLAASSVGADAAAVRTASTSYASALLQAAMADSADLQDFYSVQLSCLQHARLTPRDAGNVFVELGPQQLPLVDLLRILRQRRKAEASTQAFVTDKLREASAIITQVVFGLVSSERVVSEVRCSLPGPGAVRAGGRLVITQ